MTVVEAAVAYARRGWRVVPLHAVKADGSCTCGKATCGNSRGKHPRIDGWQNEASADETVIRGWFRSWPASNVGVVTGAISRVIVLDIDKKPEKDGEAGLRELVAKLGPLPDTLQATTGSGGRHLFFAHPGGEVKNAINLLGHKGVDVRGEAGQVAVEPSKHLSGGNYRFMDWRKEPAELPEAWRKALVVPPKPEPSDPPPPRKYGPGDLVLKRASCYLATIPGAVSGSGGHDATFKAAIALVRGFQLSPADALDLLRREFNPRCKPAWSDKELEHKVTSAANDSSQPWGYLLKGEPQAPPRTQQAAPQAREREPGEDDMPPDDGTPHTAEQTAEKPQLPAPVVICAAAVTEWGTALPEKVLTGWPSLDRVIGGLRAEATYCLVGSTGAGKSAWALQLSRQVCLYRPIVYFSCELSRRQIIARLAAAILGEPWARVYEWGPSELDRVVSAVAGLPIYVEELTKDVSVGDYLRRVADLRGAAPIMVLDYLQSLARRMAQGNTDTRTPVMRMSDELNTWARDEKSIAVLLSSTARGFYTGNDTRSATDLLGSGKDAGEIEFDARGVFFLDKGDEDEDGTTAMRLNVCKHTFGGAGAVVGLRFDGARGTFRDDPRAALTEELALCFEAIRAGASSVEEVRSAVGKQKKDVTTWIRLLKARGLVVTRGHGLAVSERL